jgi:hypothetical protein
MSLTATAMVTMAGLNLLGTFTTSRRAIDMAKDQYEANVELSSIARETDDWKALTSALNSVANAELQRASLTQKNMAKNLANPMVNSESKMTNLQGTQARIDRNAEFVESTSKMRLEGQMIENRINEYSRNASAASKALGTMTGAGSNMLRGATQSLSFGLRGYGISQAPDWSHFRNTGQIRQKGWW